MAVHWKSATDRILVTAPPPQPTETDTGIALPENRKQSIFIGTVLAAGPEAAGILPGDKVHYQASKLLVNVVEREVVSITADMVLAVERED